MVAGSHWQREKGGRRGLRRCRRGHQLEVAFIPSLLRIVSISATHRNLCLPNSAAVSALVHMDTLDATVRSKPTTCVRSSIRCFRGQTPSPQSATCTSYRRRQHSAAHLAAPRLAFRLNKDGLLGVRSLSLCRFSDAGDDDRLCTLKRPAFEKRQGRKSRSVVRRRFGWLYGDLAGASGLGCVVMIHTPVRLDRDPAVNERVALRAIRICGTSGCELSGSRRAWALSAASRRE